MKHQFLSTATLLIFSLMWLSMDLPGKSRFLPPESGQKLKVLILPSANGYEYEQANYGLDTQIRKLLSSQGSIELMKFPYKDLQGTNYYGVFDKRYCQDIIKNTDADIIIMSRFAKDSHMSTEFHWGYELRIVNTQSDTQCSSIQGDHLKSYERLIEDLKAKRESLIHDILTCRKSG
ncbi:MAG: hypothetical protein MRZ79_27325 [Bacteroidia bacterium]|nr:hypothetical protein [Bacteroidia bacterium]